jgi:hypothetical protein
MNLSPASGKRTPKVLSETLQARLNAYSLAAGAAGVGLLASVQTVGARIAYTPTHHVIKLGEKYKLDLNHDGLADFLLAGTGQSFFVYPNPVKGHNAWWGWGVFCTYSGCAAYAPFALPGGYKLPGSGSGRFINLKGTLLGQSSIGSWSGKTTGYLGVRFQIKGNVHYGWARLHMTGEPSLVILGYAYETIPNKPIIAGEKRGRDEATLGRLAQGATGVSREKK